MSVTLEVGKFYRTRDGQKVGPIYRWAEFYTGEHDGTSRLWDKTGTHGTQNIANRPNYDLIAEWTDAATGPVRTVTRSEVVRGEYGRVVVTAAGGTWMRDCFTADELRVSIATLTEIADALEAPTQ